MEGREKRRVRLLLLCVQYATVLEYLDALSGHILNDTNALIITTGIKRIQVAASFRLERQLGVISKK